jgi:hypothetical protein
MKTLPALSPQVLRTVCWALIVLGIVLRFVTITHNDLMFYDEGMYLSHNRELLEKIQQYPPKDLGELSAILKLLFNSSLMTAKWLWFFISNLRVFFGGPDAYYFTRVVSAVSGTVAIFLTFAFSRRYFGSKEIGLLSAAVLAVLPSHVFYSRLAMQESLSALCFLGGMYLYFSSREFGFRAVAASVLFSAVFFTNYRMIILPVLLAAAEVVSGLPQKKFHWPKLVGTSLAFFGIVFWIGSLNHGSNRFITTAWMTHQAQEAPQQWHLVNLFSYPYDLFALDGVLFGLAFFSNIYGVVRRQWTKLLPFAVVIVQMAMFTFAPEKGARYLCVVLPFAAMATAAVIDEHVIKDGSFRRIRAAAVILLFGFFFCLAQRSWEISRPVSGYKTTARFLNNRDPQAKVLTTQPLVMGLFMGPQNVQPAPKTARDLIILYARGYRYLAIDPQAYVSWTADGQRFTFALTDYMGFIRDRLKPLYVGGHLNGATLQRFVLDHNENLANSVRFLSRRDQDFGSIYVYDLAECLAVMQKVAQSMNN